MFVVPTAADAKPTAPLSCITSAPVIATPTTPTLAAAYTPTATLNGRWHRYSATTYVPLVCPGCTQSLSSKRHPYIVYSTQGTVQHANCIVRLAGFAAIGLSRVLPTET